MSEIEDPQPTLKYWNAKTQGLLLFALAFLVYGFGIGRGFDFDDPIYISQNALLGRADAFHTFWFTSEASNYYPLFWSLLRVQWLLWGVHPLGYHLVNLIMHSVNAVLVWRIAREWRLPGAWWVAALFAVHPRQCPDSRLGGGAKEYLVLLLHGPRAARFHPARARWPLGAIRPLAALVRRRPGL
ncbi:MAG: hypothetical protein WDN28_16855 [Chthoniobacter sp.]